MAITQLIFNEKNLLGNIELDVIITETVNATARLTKNPVENGADINDHIIIEPMTFTMNGVVSNASSNLVDVAKNVSNTQTNAETAWSEMLKLMTFKTPFNLFQNTKKYENVVLISLSRSQDKETSKALYFTANLSQLILVGTGGTPTTTFEDQDTSDKASPSTSGGLKSIV